MAELDQCVAEFQAIISSQQKQIEELEAQDGRKPLLEEIEQLRAIIEAQEEALNDQKEIIANQSSLIDELGSHLATQQSNNASLIEDVEELNDFESFSRDADTPSDIASRGTQSGPLGLASCGSRLQGAAVPAASQRIGAPPARRAPAGGASGRRSSPGAAGHGPQNSTPRSNSLRQSAPSAGGMGNSRASAEARTRVEPASAPSPQAQARQRRTSPPSHAYGAPMRGGNSSGNLSSGNLSGSANSSRTNRQQVFNQKLMNRVSRPGGPTVETPGAPRPNSAGMRH